MQSTYIEPLISTMQKIENEFKNEEYVVHRMELPSELSSEALTKHFESLGYDVVKKCFELEIIHPQREANARFRYFEQDFMAKLYDVIRVPEQKNTATALIRILRERGYTVNIFQASCYHRAHCDTSSIKCQSLHLPLPNHEGTFCSHRCNSKCRSGPYMKITIVSSMKPVDLMFHLIQKRIRENSKDTAHAIHSVKAPKDMNQREELVKMLEASYKTKIWTSTIFCDYDIREDHVCDNECVASTWLEISDKSVISSL